jgi:hypothetical protein
MHHICQISGRAQTQTVHEDIRGVMIGYSPNSPRCRANYPVTVRITTSIHVRFQEYTHGFGVSRSVKSSTNLALDNVDDDVMPHDVGLPSPQAADTFIGDMVRPCTFSGLRRTRVHSAPCVRYIVCCCPGDLSEDEEDYPCLASP